MTCIVHAFATAPDLERVPRAAPWPVLARQVPRELVAMLNRGGDRGARFLPLIGVVDGRRRFLEPAKPLPVEMLLKLHGQSTAPQLLVDGELGPDFLRVRAVAGNDGDVRLTQELPFDPTDPWPTLSRAAFELAGLVGISGPPAAPPALRGTLLARWFEARDMLLILEAKMLPPDVGAVLDVGLAAVREGPARLPVLHVLVDLCRQLAAAGMRDERIAAALRESLNDAPLALLRDAALVAEAASGAGAAAELWGRVATEDPSRTEALTRAASGLFELGRLEDARELLRHAVDAGNRDPELRAQLAAVEELGGDPLKRDRLLSELLEEAGAGLPPKVLRLVASWLIDRGEAERALELLEEASRVDPTLPGPWLERGRALLALGRGPDARQALERCLELRPSVEGRDEARRLLRLTSADGYLPLALEVEAGLAAGEPRCALRAAKRLVAAHPRFTESWLLLGLARHRCGHLRRATRAYAHALRLEPRCAEAHHRLGLVLAQRGRPDAGFTHLQHAVAIEPSDPAAWIHLAQIAHGIGRRVEARDAVRRAERLGGSTTMLDEVRARLGDEA